MKRKKLIIYKSKVYVFNLFWALDKTNGNTYKAFVECYIIDKNQRKHMIDYGYMIPGDKQARNIYSDGSATVKQWLLDYHNFDINWMSDYPNIVVCEKEINLKKLLNR